MVNPPWKILYGLTNRFGLSIPSVLPFRNTLLFMIGCLMPGTLSACGRQTPLLTATDYEMEADSDRTSLGVSVGDDSEAFLSAYGEYEILSSINGDDYKLLSDEEIPFTDNTLITIVPTFFIDGLPVDTDRFCKENEIAKSDLLSFLTSEEYLSAHTVVYQYLRSTSTDGLITEISSEAMDYNADAAYYNAN